MSRCFPHCCLDGHHDSGFCGRSAEVTVHNSSISQAEWFGSILAVAEFRPTDTEGLSSQESIPKTVLLSHIRTPTNPLGVYNLGEICHDRIVAPVVLKASQPSPIVESTDTSTSEESVGSSSIITGQSCRGGRSCSIAIEFNGERMAWHYGWRSSKWHNNVSHLMDVVLLQDIGTNDLLIVASYLSNEFSILSTKKARTEFMRRPKQGSSALEDDISKIYFYLLLNIVNSSSFG